MCQSHCEEIISEHCTGAMTTTESKKQNAQNFHDHIYNHSWKAFTHVAYLQY